MATTQEDQPLNIRQLQGSRKRLHPGDIFVMQLPDDRYAYGRVIMVQVPEGPFHQPNLIYLYRDAQASKTPDLSQLTVDRLLRAPKWINRLPWSRGYFETVANEPLTPSDLVAQHCFKSIYNKWGAPYLDEKGNPLSERHEPCGTWGIAGYYVVDAILSDHFGFPRANDYRL